MIKLFNKQNKRKLPQHNKGHILKNPTGKIILHSDKIESFSSKIMNKTRKPIFNTSTYKTLNITHTHTQTNTHLLEIISVSSKIKDTKSLLFCTLKLSEKKQFHSQQHQKYLGMSITR